MEFMRLPFVFDSICFLSFCLDHWNNVYPKEEATEALPRNVDMVSVVGRQCSWIPGRTAPLLDIIKKGWRIAVTVNAADIRIIEASTSNPSRRKENSWNE